MSVPVRLLDAAGPRWEPSELEEYLTATPAPQMPATVTVEALALSPDAWPPGRKLQLLLDADDAFRRTWERRRRDLPSQSEYDLALANIAVTATWTDQEIADLLIAHRSRHGEDLKLRQDYYQRTIELARGAGADRAATELLQDHADTAQPAERAELLAALALKLGVAVQRLMRYDPALGDPFYRLQTERGTITLSAGDLLSASRFRVKLAAATGHAIREYRAAQWHAIAQALLDVSETDSLGEEETTDGRVLSWLLSYVADRRVVGEERWQEALSSSSPYWRDGGCWIVGKDLRRWLKSVEGEMLTSQQVGALLRAAGATADTHGDGTTSRYVWRLPPDAARMIAQARHRAVPS